MSALQSLLPQLPRTAELSCAVPVTKLTRALRDLGLPNVDVEIEPGLRVSTAHLTLPTAARVRTLRSLTEDLALRLGLASVRVRTGVKAGRVTLELAHNIDTTPRVSLGDVLSQSSGADLALPWAVGIHVNGAPMLVDLAEAPHVLIGGQTGSGKSSHLHALVTSLAMHCAPETLELVFVDPKQVDLVAFEDLPHVRRGVVTTTAGAQDLVQELLDETEFRYEELARAGMPDLASYNAWAAEEEGEEPMPRIVAVIDELAMLMVGKEGQALADQLTQLAQTSRAAGIHLVLATQRPSAASMPTQLRSQLTTRVACRMATTTDSRMIVDTTGAEKLLGAGDTLVRFGGADPVRVQGVYVSKAWRSWLINELVRLLPEVDESNDDEEGASEDGSVEVTAPSGPRQSWWSRLFV